MRRAIAIAGLIVSIATLACAGEQELRLLDALVAKVDTDIVTLSEVKAEMAIIGWPGDVAPPGPRVLVRDLVRRKLLVAQAEKLKMDVQREAIDDEVDTLASAGKGEDAFWSRMKSVGFTRSDVVKRMREVALSRNLVSLKRRSTYVPEVDVRAFYRDNRSTFGEKTLGEARETIREHLATRKYMAELSAWISEQTNSGRVRLMPLPSELGE